MPADPRCASRARLRGGGRWRVLALISAACAACSPDVEERAIERSERYGVLRDLVLFERPMASGGPFFLDRFETTQADWKAYLEATRASPADSFLFQNWNEPGASTLPVVGVTRYEASAYARWRFGRLARYDEWEYAATAGGQYALPWGDTYRSAWANTRELDLNRLTPVGTFESGRQSGGPYDLIGNAAEWTATPAPGCIAPSTPPGPGDPWFGDAVDLPWRVRAAAQLGRFSIGVAPIPAIWLLRVETSSVPFLVVDGAWRPMMGARRRPSLPGDRSQRVGLRVATDPSTLLHRLLAERETPDPRTVDTLQRFLRKPAHRRVLRAELLRDPRQLEAGGSLARLVRAELRP